MSGQLVQLYLLLEFVSQRTPAPPQPDGSMNDEDLNSPNNENEKHPNNKYQESRNGAQSEQQLNTHVPPPGYSGSMGSSTGNTEEGTGANKNSRPGPNMMSNMMQANGPLPQNCGPPPLLSTQLSTPGRPIVKGTPVPPQQLIRPDGSLNDEDHNSPNNENERHLNNKYQESRNGAQSEQQLNTHVPPPGYSESMGSSTGNTEEGTGANKNSRPGPNMMSNMMQANGPLPQNCGPPPLLSTQLSTPGRPIVKGTPVPPRQLIRPDGSLNDEDHNSPINENERHLNNKYQESRNGAQSEQQLNTHVPPPGYSESMGSSTGNTEEGKGANKNSRPGPNMMSNMKQANGPLPQNCGPPPLLSTQLSTPGRPIVKGTSVPPQPIQQLIRPDGSLKDHNSPNNENERHLNNKYQESRNGSQSEQQLNTHVPPPGYSKSMGSSTGNTKQGTGANKNSRPGPNTMSNMMQTNGPLPQMCELSKQLSSFGRPIVKEKVPSTHARRFNLKKVKKDTGSYHI
ncbi:unnamed protein product [Mytilus coruscus]|uniref:Uncharacterized protein n=1 Tax=Mytilus coruscus TaxID=42192 RepID=A0A6J8B359_MYTCO|nr:unnamed protein product [Mytilus coruscus]